MDANIETAIKDYYNLKTKYEKKINNSKDKIRKNSGLSIKDKRLQIKQIVKTCVNCNNKGGTIFKTDNNTLIAMCGCPNPCKLNININRGKYTNIRNTEQDIQNEIKEIKKSIMRLKLDLLFNYSDENKILNEFNKLRKDLSDFTQSLVIHRKEYISIVENDDNKKILDEETRKLYEITEELKKIKANYDANKNTTYLKDMVEIYIRDIVPLASNIQKLNYKYNYLDCDDCIDENDKINLIQSEYVYSDLYVPLNNSNKPSINMNRK